MCGLWTQKEKLRRLGLYSTSKKRFRGDLRAPCWQGVKTVRLFLEVNSNGMRDDGCKLERAKIME